MQSHALDHLSLFKEMLKKYTESEHLMNIDLTDDEVEQLSWHMDINEIKEKAKLQAYKYKMPAEIREALLRRHFLQLVLNGDTESHFFFTISQNKEDSLSFEDFSALSNELHSLGDDVITALKMSCHLIISEKSLPRLRAATKLKLIGDRDEALAEMVALLSEKPTLLPVTRTASHAALKHLVKMYWPKLNFRKLSLSDGFNHVADSVRTADFTQDDLKVWGARWLVNAFGENIGFMGATKFLAGSYSIYKMVMEELALAMQDKNHSYLDGYLSKRAQLLGYDPEHLDSHEPLFVAHLAAMFSHFPVVSGENAQAVLAGYRAFKAANPAANLAEAFAKRRCASNVAEPVHVTDILRNIYYHLLSNYSSKYSKDKAGVLRDSIEIMCLCLHGLYQQPLTATAISCGELYLQLRTLVHRWQQNKSGFTFELAGNDLLMHFSLNEQEQQMMDAVRENNADAVMKLLSLPDCTPSFTDEHGNSPLMYALKGGHAATALQLLADKRSVTPEKNNKNVSYREMADEHPQLLPSRLVRRELSFEEAYALVLNRDEFMIKVCRATHNSVELKKRDKDPLITCLIMDNKTDDASWLCEFLGENFISDYLRAYANLGLIDKIEELFKTSQPDAFNIHFVVGLFARAGNETAVMHFISKLEKDSEDYLTACCKAAECYSESAQPENHRIEMIKKLIAISPSERENKLFESLKAGFMKSGLLKERDQALRIIVQFDQEQLRHRLSWGCNQARLYKRLLTDSVPMTPEEKYDYDIIRLTRQAERIRGVMLSLGLGFDDALAKVNQMSKSQRRDMRLFSHNQSSDNPKAKQVWVVNESMPDSDDEEASPRPGI